MFQKLSALMSPEGDDAAGGAAATGGDENHQDKDKPGDKDVVPKSQFLAAIHSANQKYAALESKFNELAAKVEKPAVDPPKRYTRAQLNAAVEAGHITQADADAQLEVQTREEARAEARREATEVVTQDKLQERVSNDIAQYKRLAPEILEEGSDTRTRIQEEYQYLTSLGEKPSVATELKAIRAVLGPIDRLEKARSGKSKADSHRETGGEADGGDDGVKTTGGGKLVKTLTAREKTYYSSLIQKGQYKDWAEVEETLTYAKPETRRKHGARV